MTQRPRLKQPEAQRRMLSTIKMNQAKVIGENILPSSRQVAPLECDC